MPHHRRLVQQSSSFQIRDQPGDWFIDFLGVQPMVMEVFETMALSQLIPIAPDEPAAMALLAA